MRSMVEGPGAKRRVGILASLRPLHHAAARRGPPPRSGEDLLEPSMSAARPAPILPLALFLAVLLTAGWTALAWADLSHLVLPDTDDMMRLAQIREQRRAGSRYATLKQCRWELEQADRLMRQAGIPSLNTTHVSIEEIASKIFDRFGIERTMF